MAKSKGDEGFVINSVGDRQVFASDYNHGDSKFSRTVEAVMPYFPLPLGETRVREIHEE